MNVTCNYHSFCRQVGMIFHVPDLKQLGLQTENIGGAFRGDDVDDLLDFCAQNPQFHVVTSLGKGMYVNRYHSKGLSFFLANGDRSPDLMLNASFLLESMGLLNESA